MDVGLWTRKPSSKEAAAAPDHADGGGSGRGGGGGVEGYGGGQTVEAGDETGVVPWPAEALEAASALGKERARRGASYDKKEPRGGVGEPAPFGRYGCFLCCGSCGGVGERWCCCWCCC